MESSTSLARRAAVLLQGGPLAAADLARQIMGLTGPPVVAASLVRTLLERDDRFEVDEAGRWRLSDPTDLPGPVPTSLDFAVVDVETTGSPYHRGHRVTEVAVVLVEGGVVSDSFVTLVNPGRRIPKRIQALTGITDQMVARAPHFDAVAEEVAARLAGRVFVAHNAPFDWGFVEAELLAASGEVPEVTRLCTVRLARALLPQLRRHHLDSVAGHFDVTIEGRHRAYGDALATARILLRLLDEAALQGATDLVGLIGVMGKGGARRRSHTKGRL